ncbi:transcriptional regulator with GAF, ATPase, and Fis domain [Nocardioides zeae]|uniref:Transcriptional regulator with GAF, ATPase, and Fis domain n=1 Tax=Nocardioides zeae TaxID=1457234 RepID=A0AAJ1X271_9ACTN|nr:transcriptional regulator with GAF, ATPase, and Fis domain [Nocardioides zeae]
MLDVRVSDLGRRMAELALELHDLRGVDATREQLVAASRDLLPSCTEATLAVLGSDGSLSNVAATDPRVRRADELQQVLDEGPALDALRGEALVHSYDLAAESRWPDWSSEIAGDLGVRSLLSLRLATQRDEVGVLTLYSDAVGGFGHEERESAQVLATHGAVALAAAHDVERMLDAMTRRTRIGAAMGIVMERFELEETVAFEVLRRLSQEQNRKLVDIADELVREREVDGLGPPRRD